MKKLVLMCVISMMISGIAFADVLPGPVPENQVFGTTSAIDGVMLTHESTSLIWQVGDKKYNQVPAPYGDPYGRGSVKSGSISYSVYKDSIYSNGGMISEVKSFNLDTHPKRGSMHNVNTEKILTYNSQMGSHLLGRESFILDVAGNWTWTPSHNGLLCVFASALNESLLPAFCSKVTAASKLTSITTAQVQARGSIRPIAASKNVPAALNYEIAVTPDASSASGYAEGIVSTTFTVSVLEGRIDGNFSPGLVLNMLRGYPIYAFHGASGMFLNAGPVGSFMYGETGGDNSIFIGTSSGVPVGGGYDIYDSNNPGGITTPGGHCMTDTNINCASAGIPGNQGYWGEDVIVVVKEGVTILDTTSTILLSGGTPSGPASQVQSLSDGYVINLDGLRLTKNGGGFNTLTGESEEVWWTVEFTDYFGRIPPNSSYDIRGTGNQPNPAYKVPPESVRTGAPFLEFFDRVGATLTSTDTAMFAGSISMFTKSFEYTSGVACVDC